jgi:signal transduction histidine kinase
VTSLFRYLLALGLICLSLDWTVAYADDPDDISQDVIDFFDTVGMVEPDISADTINLPQSVTSIREIVEATAMVDEKRLQTALTELQGSTFAKTEQGATILDFGRALETALQAEAEASEADPLSETLEGFLSQDDWYIRSIAGSLLSHVQLTQNNFLVSARYVENAMDIIPSDLSDETTYARLLASEAAMALHGVQGNPAFMLDAARVQSETKHQLGETINRYELMTNFVYALNRDRDFAGAARVANMLLLEPQPDNAVAGLSETYMAETYNALGQYRRALTLSETAISAAQHPVIAQRARRPYLIALAGLGRENAARARMREWGWAVDRDALLTTKSNDAVLYAEALLAMHRDETQLSIDLMKRWADLQIDSVQSSNSAGMTSLLSNLENTRERQAERESALQREAELKEIQLAQQNRLNRLLWILIGGLTLAFNFLLAFLRYREKNNAKVRGLQEEALSAEKMKTEFLGVINHELRTPLNGIIGISDAMIHHADDPVLKSQAEAVQESGQLLFDLLDSLITMSTIEADRLSLDKNPVDLSRVIADEAKGWDAKAAEKGLTYTHFIAKDVSPKILGDSARIRQCLHYLLSNAIRFTHEGRVHLHVTGTQKAGHMAVTITVADTGQGISEDVQSRLFKPFLQADATMTRKYGGAGLSLAIARKLARMMGGDLVVNSRQGCGSEFTLTLCVPLAEATKRTGTAEPAALTETGIDQTKNDEGRAKVAQPDMFDGLEEPEEIIDLMLRHPLLQDAPASPSRSNVSAKSAGKA